MKCLPPRIPFDKLESHLKNEFASMEDDEYGYEISKLTPMNLAVPAFNFLEGLLDTRVKMEAKDYGLFRLIEDYGVRMLSYGNAAGGVFYGPYRSFLVEVNGSTEFYSISVTTYCKSTHPDKVKTCIVVAHDNEKETHHALQLVVEDNLITNGKKIDFYHHGKIAIGNMGSGKVDELRMFVEERYPKIIKGHKFYLGTLIHDRLWNLNDTEVENLIVNMISYSMIRYHHMRSRLESLLEENNLLIYPEYYFKDLKYRADIAIVEIDPDSDSVYLADRVKNVIALFELKYSYGTDEQTAIVIKDDVWKIRDSLGTDATGLSFFLRLFALILLKYSCLVNSRSVGSTPRPSK